MTDNEELVTVKIRRKYLDAAGELVRMIAGPDARPTPQFCVEMMIAAAVNEVCVAAADAELRGVTLQ